MMIGSLMRACADYDQGLHRMVVHLRMGQNILDSFTPAEDGSMGWRPKPHPDVGAVEDGYAETRQKLIKVLANGLTGSEHLPEVKTLFEAAKGPHEIRDIVAHWDLIPFSRDQIVARSFIATEGLPLKATRLMEKYRTPPRRPEHAGTDFHDRTITLSFDQVIGARDQMRDINGRLGILTAMMSVSYMNAPGFPRPPAR